MFTYIITFAISLLFMHLAIKGKVKRSGLLFHILAIIPPVFLLTFRAEECGTDTTHYIYIFDGLFTGNIGTLLAESRLEPLFILLVYSIKSIGLSVEFLFFMCGLLTIVPVYYGSIKMRKVVSPLLPMALFYLMFYQYSFNIVRQSIAMSLVFLAMVYLIENKKIPSLLIGLSAVLFHVVAVVFFIVYIIFRNNKFSFVGSILSFLLLVVFVYLFQSFFSDKLDTLMEYTEAGKQTVLQMSYMLEMTLNFFVVAVLWKKDKQLKPFFIYVSGMVVLLFLASTMGTYIFRIANCLDILLLVYIPIALKNSNNKNYTLAYMFFAVFFWLYIFVLQGNGATCPYVLSPNFHIFS